MLRIHLNKVAVLPSVNSYTREGCFPEGLNIRDKTNIISRRGYSGMKIGNHEQSIPFIDEVISIPFVCKTKPV